MVRLTVSLAADTCGKILNIVTTVRRLEYSIRSVCFSLLFLVKQPRDEAMCALFFSIFLDHLCPCCCHQPSLYFHQEVVRG